MICRSQDLAQIGDALEAVPLVGPTAMGVAARTSACSVQRCAAGRNAFRVRGEITALLLLLPRFSPFSLLARSQSEEASGAK